MLSQGEIARYSRHLLLPEIGRAGQEQLKRARVLVIGAGGLGCPALMYMGAAGIGTIGIVDFDVVDETNLQRQVLYAANDVGRSKAEVSAQKLSAQNPFIEVRPVKVRLDVQNALELFSGYDIIVDGTDNFSTRYLINDACVILGKPLVSGSVFKFQGQVSVFNFKHPAGSPGPTYRCLFPSPPASGSSLSCAETGVMGVLPGMIGTLMTNEVIKIITGVGEVLAGKLLLVDSLSMKFQTVEIERNPEAMNMSPQNAVDFKRTDYDLFCGIRKAASSIREISAHELSALISSNENIQMLDVRENGELPLVPELKGLHIPLGEIEKRKALISRDKMVIVFCRSGARSRKAVELLSKDPGFSNLSNLKGGVMEWIRTFSEKQPMQGHADHA